MGISYYGISNWASLVNKNLWAGRHWSVEVQTDAVIVRTRKWEEQFDPEQSIDLVPKRWLLWWFLCVDDARILRLSGIRRNEAEGLRMSLRRLQFLKRIDQAQTWKSEVQDFLSSRRQVQRWITREETEQLVAQRPRPRLFWEIEQHQCLELFSESELEAARFLEVDVPDMVRRLNEEIMEAELVDCKQFLNTIESSPLTEEQSRAVICLDNRVQLLAAAGSGKTSVMVARAAYVVSRGFIEPDRILLLAFNKAAAAELQERISARFEAAGINATGIRATTFHSFGLQVIGETRGRKPRLAKWIENDDLQAVMTIVDELRSSSLVFRYRWDLYRLFYASAPSAVDGGSPDAFDKSKKESRYRTFGGDLVKSEGERLIANFLYLNGVAYQYEKPFSSDLSDAQHSQYFPDFYYPDIDVWHEHWALDVNGRAPDSFVGYEESIAWKRQIHLEHKTTFIETTWAGVMFDDGLEQLKRQLEELGLNLDWNPDRPVVDGWLKPLKHEEIAKRIRTFMSHVKSNSLSRKDLEDRLNGAFAQLKGFRTNLFLDIFWEIFDAWEHLLTSERSVDYEDMLLKASDCVEEGGYQSPYDMVMVDEFQDVSNARARLISGLLKRPNTIFLAVGDDWQSINRFSGADVSVMTNFDGRFGEGPQLALTTTFRCGQVICDVASDFVSENPSQFKKAMKAVAGRDPGMVKVILSVDEAKDLSDILWDFSDKLERGEIEPNNKGGLDFDVLGRYNFLKELMPTEPPPNIRVTFRTIHAAKGLEADFVIIPGLEHGNFGLPSQIADDPILQLATVRQENFPHAEERRLLYVALTRAKRGAFLLAPGKKPSVFVAELAKHAKVVSTSHIGAMVRVCPKCSEGFLVSRLGPWGNFYGCSKFPTCAFTEKERAFNVRNEVSDDEAEPNTADSEMSAWKSVSAAGKAFPNEIEMWNAVSSLPTRSGWSVEEDGRLLIGFRAGKTVKVLSIEFVRSPGAIRARHEVFVKAGLLPADHAIGKSISS